MVGLYAQKKNLIHTEKINNSNLNKSINKKYRIYKSSNKFIN